MIVIYSNDHEAAPLLGDPLEEHNLERATRPVYKKVRKVRGKTGYLLRRYGWIFGAPKNDPVGVGHWGLQIGAYVYEMTREKGLVGQRLAGDQIWHPRVAEILIGYTDLSDEDVQMEALKAQAYSRSRSNGKYHLKKNNCHHFINELQRRIFAVPDMDDSAVSISSNGKPSTETAEDVVTPSSITRHDSMEPEPSTEKELKIRDSTFAPLRVSAFEVYARADAKKGAVTVGVVTPNVSALSCA